MNIGLIDVDKNKFPNLALMKLSAFHKSKGDNVEFVQLGKYDRTYISKVFSYTPNYDTMLTSLGEVIKGGSGYNFNSLLNDEIEHIMPNYSLYNIKNRAYGFLTRGCPNKCSWCIVPEKEGTIKSNADITEFWDGQKEVLLLDNNVLANEHGLHQIEKLIDIGVKVDFNQGLDARIIAGNRDIAELLSKLKWIRYIRLACDTKGQIPIIENAIKNLNEFGVKNYRIFVYTLVKGIEDALFRVNFLKKYNVRVFAQPYRNLQGDVPTKIQRDFARWVNHRAIFETVKWDDYQIK